MATDQIGNGKREMGFDGSNMHGYSFVPDAGKSGNTGGNEGKGKGAAPQKKR